MQFKYILGLELGPKTFIMPTIVALGFSTLVMRMRFLQRALNAQSCALLEMNQEVTKLNQQLTHRLSDRTQLLHEVKDQLSDAQQMGAMGSLTEGALQQLNTSLMVISSVWDELEELLSSKPTERTQDELTSELREVIQHALRHASEYHELNSLPATGDGGTPIIELINRLTPLLSRSFVSGQQLSVSWDNPAPCQVRLALPRLVQVILNLVENARESLTGNPGQVKIKLVLLSQHGADSLQLSVVDTGCGMTEEVKARATEAFFSTKQGGVGLGLHVSLNAAREAGGSLMISSAVGAGTRVRLTLPCVPL